MQTKRLKVYILLFVALNACHKSETDQSPSVERAALLSSALYPSMPVNGTDSAQTGALDLEDNDSQVRGFYFEVRQPGTLLLSKLNIRWGSCSREAINILTSLKLYSEQGELSSIHELDAHRPIRFLGAARGIVEISVHSLRKCQGLGIEVFARFYEQNQQKEGSNTGMLADGSSESTGEAGETAGEPSKPITPNPPDTPQRPPILNPCPSPPNSQNGAYAASIEIVGERSRTEGCVSTYVWNTWKNVRPDPGNGCRLPAVGASVEGPSNTSMLKWQEVDSEVARPLVWLSGVNAAVAQDMASRLNRGDNLVFTRDESCLRYHPEAHLLDSDVNLLILAGDPRTADMPAYGVPADLELDHTQAVPLRVQYRYEAPGAERFFISFAYKSRMLTTMPTLPVGNVRVNIFHRRTRSYIGSWTAITGNVSEGSFKISDVTVLKRLLPRLAEVEVVFRGDHSDGTGVIASLPLYAIFNDASSSASFEDLTHPGRSRFLLREEDLP